MVRVRGHPLVSLFLPENLARLPVDRVDHPAVNVGGRLQAFASEIEALLGGLLLALANYRCQEDLVVPDNGRGPTSTGNIHFPDDILRGAPGIRQSLVFDDAGGRTTAECRPACLGLSSCGQ